MPKTKRTIVKKKNKNSNKTIVNVHVNSHNKRKTTTTKQSQGGQGQVIPIHVPQFMPQQFDHTLLKQMIHEHHQEHFKEPHAPRLMLANNIHEIPIAMPITQELDRVPASPTVGMGHVETPVGEVVPSAPTRLQALHAHAEVGTSPEKKTPLNFDKATNVIMKAALHEYKIRGISNAKKHILYPIYVMATRGASRKDIQHELDRLKGRAKATSDASDTD